ncbi:enoyl-CoA hydratase-related protein [Robiginitomaculum antarcticum]|uniref:enoyl-CoA hydratase-related protein n=1 Tax=Robiginitomaculum antarcticum TaxID=437507 RepID=UPI00039F0131|nr:enoyl-CoA hydratase-related protein [Robiginitomaculum antarcticum]
MDTLKTHRDGAVQIITLHRPERMNAFTSHMCMEICAAIDAAEAYHSVRAIVITGHGKTFCAGADISGGFTGAGLAVDPIVHEGVERDFGGVLTLRLWECDVPIIGAINGSAAGIGLTMTFPMDIRIASDKAKFALPFTRRGIVWDAASSWFLPRLIGLAKASELSLTGRTFLSDEALSLGLMHELAAPEDVLPRALEIARDIAQNVSPRSARLNKQLLRQAMADQGGPMDAHLRESVTLAESFISADCQEGVRAFFEKRAPKFGDYQPN